MRPFVEPALEIGWSISRILALSWQIWAPFGHDQDLARNTVQGDRALFN
jgi:hypothetical protein